MLNTTFKEIKMSERYIRFQDVKKSYGSGEAQINALAGVDFEIEKGEFCILLGSNLKEFLLLHLAFYYHIHLLIL